MTDLADARVLVKDYADGLVDVDADEVSKAIQGAADALYELGNLPLRECGNCERIIDRLDGHLSVLERLSGATDYISIAARTHATLLNGAYRQGKAIRQTMNSKHGKRAKRKGARKARQK